MPASPLFVAVSQAWSEGLGLSEREALCALAVIDSSHAKTAWQDLSAAHVDRIVLAFRRAISLGQACGAALVDDGTRQLA